MNNAVKTAIASINEAIRKRDEAMAPFIAEMKKVSAEALTTIFVEFFNKYPQVKTIYWQQYTPEWNDGEECVFSVREVFFSPVEIEDIEDPHFDDDLYDDDGDEEKMAFNSYSRDDKPDATMKKDMEEIQSYLSGVLKNHLEEFGDAFIRVNRNEIKIMEQDPPY